MPISRSFLDTATHRLPDPDFDVASRLFGSWQKKSGLEGTLVTPV